jgi:hypothetical protein
LFYRENLFTVKHKGKIMSRSTPWGTSQSIHNHARGIATVSTASHGGLMISNGVAQNQLSEEARNLAMVYGGYHCYEEDDMYFVPLMDSDFIRNAVSPAIASLAGKSEAEVEQYLVDSISVSNPAFLIKIGVNPNKDSYEKWQIRLMASEARANNDPDAIVTCFGSHETIDVNLIRVTTASGIDCFITKESYKSVVNDDKKSLFMKLSDMHIVPQESLPPLEERFLSYICDNSLLYLQCIKDNTEESDREVAGVFYGPRSRFNGTVKSAMSTLASKLNAEQILSVINKAKEVISPEFHKCSIFSEQRPN